MSASLESLWEERAAIADSLGIVKCDHCLRFCPYCPRLLAVRPDLANPPPQTSSIPEPGFFQKVANFGRAITQHLSAGLPQADKATVAYRLNVCHTCEHFNKAQAACMICGCNTEIKVQWAEQHCPIKKW